jgi:hypothetical protein
MTSREPSNPVAHRLVAAINDGDRDAFLAHAHTARHVDRRRQPAVTPRLDRPRDLLRARSHERRA